ncbi:hypothetical protein ACFL55_02365 [Candidatus Latescibacterota bacterium]
MGLFVGLLSLICFYYYTEKDKIIKDINEIIEDCRGCNSFDEKSESKMYSWLELGEGGLHRKSLFTLKKIKKEMERYYKIHFEEDFENMMKW